MKALLREFRKRGLLVRFFLLFSCLTIVPVALVSIVHYRFSTETLEDQIHRSNRSMLNSTIRNIDEKLSHLRDSVFVFAFSYEERYLDIGGELTDEFRYRVFKTTEDLKNLVNANSDTIENAFICFVDHDMVISVDGQYSFEYFLNHVYIYDGRDAESWGRYLKGQHRFDFLETTRVLNGNTNTAKKLLTICTSIPFSKETSISIVLTVSERLLADSLRSMDIGDSGGFLAFDRDKVFVSAPWKGATEGSIGEIKRFIAERGYEEGKFLFKDRIITHVRSVFTGWSYLTIVSREDVLKKTANIKLVTVIACGLFFIFGLTLSILLSANMYRPIGEIIRVIDGSMTSYDIGRMERGNEYGYIFSRICSINKSNTALSRFVTESLDGLQEKLLFDILNGTVTDRIAIGRRMKRFGLDFSYRRHLAVVCKVDYYGLYLASFPEKERTVNEENLIGNVNAYLSQDNKVFRVNGIRGVTVFVVMSNSEDIGRGIVDALYHMLPLLQDNRKYMRLTLGVGNPCDDILDLRLSFKGALESIGLRKMTQENQVIPFTDEPRPEFRVFRMHDQEKAIVNNMLTGDYRHAVSLIREIIDANAVGGIPYRDMKNLVREILGYSEKLPHGREFLAAWSRDPDVFEKAGSLATADEMKEYLEDVFCGLGEHIARNGGGRTNLLKQKIIRIVEENYGDELCLRIVAQKLNMSPKYFSGFFSDHFGENFAKYIMEIRIRRANELLAGTAMRVKEIAQAVGYRNVNSFIRAYRNFEGISPGKLRRNVG